MHKLRNPTSAVMQKLDVSFFLLLICRPNAVILGFCEPSGITIHVFLSHSKLICTGI